MSAESGQQIDYFGQQKIILVSKLLVWSANVSCWSAEMHRSGQQIVSSGKYDLFAGLLHRTLITNEMSYSTKSITAKHRLLRKHHLMRGASCDSATWQWCNLHYTTVSIAQANRHHIPTQSHHSDVHHTVDTPISPPSRCPTSGSWPGSVVAGGVLLEYLPYMCITMASGI